MSQEDTQTYASPATTGQKLGDDLPEGANEYGQVKVGRFLSRSALDSVVLRRGVSEQVPFQAINYCDEKGRPLHRICLVSTPWDKNWVEHHRALYNVMALLHEGEQSIRQKMEIERVAAGVKPVSLAQASTKWPIKKRAH